MISPEFLRIIKNNQINNHSTNLAYFIISLSIVGLLILFISGVLTLRNAQLGRRNRNRAMADIAEIDIYTTEFGMAIVGFLLALFAILSHIV